MLVNETFFDQILALRMNKTLPRLCWRPVEHAGLRRRTALWALRLLSCRFFIQMIQYLLNYVRLFNTGDHLNGSPALITALNINIEDPLQSLRPVHRRSAFFG
jgi:hypothetical protein